MASRILGRKGRGAFLFFALWMSLSGAVFAGPGPELKNGDLIFQSNVAGQGGAIMEATGSPYTHVGIVFIKGGEPMVFEAAATVRFTPLSAFIKRGDGGRYIVRRLSDADERITPVALKAMRAEAASFAGKSYDLQFMWSDEKIYCSELVWKIYDRALKIQIGKTRKFNDYRLNSPVVQEIIRERYGASFPLDELAVGPGDMFESPLLQTVAEGP